MMNNIAEKNRYFIRDISKLKLEENKSSLVGNWYFGNTKGV